MVKALASGKWVFGFQTFETNRLLTQEGLVEIDPTTICRPVYRDDVNGTPIYEHDLVDWEITSGSSVKPNEVIYYPEEGRFILQAEQCKFPILERMRIKIVGNTKEEGFQ